MMGQPDLAAQLAKMQQDWDARARENARFYVNTARQDWTDEEFFRSGEGTVAEEILTDMINICQGKDPKTMSVLEVGCGAGRVTRALAQVFGRVCGVDISGEMVRQARAALAGMPQVRIVQNNGKDLSALGKARFDFAFSSIVFQHIPSCEVIESYVREVHRRLRRGGLFKFQVQGGAELDTSPEDTWIGVTFSEQEARDMALRCGFEMRHSYGAGTQYYWLWFFKPKFTPQGWWWRGKYAARVAYHRWRGRAARALERARAGLTRG
jgi:SAM-dependent methyltransferase